MMPTIKFYSLAVEYRVLCFHLNCVKMGTEVEVTLAYILIQICKCAYINMY